MEGPQYLIGPHPHGMKAPTPWCRTPRLPPTLPVYTLTLMDSVPHIANPETKIKKDAGVSDRSRNQDISPEKLNLPE